jgi:hypothetical protein
MQGSFRSLDDILSGLWFSAFAGHPNPPFPSPARVKKKIRPIKFFAASMHGSGGH